MVRGLSSYKRNNFISRALIWAVVSLYSPALGAQSKPQEYKTLSAPVYVGDQAKNKNGEGSAEAADSNSTPERDSVQPNAGSAEPTAQAQTEGASPATAADGGAAFQAPEETPEQPLVFEYDKPAEKPATAIDSDALSANKSILAAERASSELQTEINHLNNIYDYEEKTRKRLRRSPQSLAFKDREYQYPTRGEFLEKSGYLILDAKRKIDSLTRQIIGFNQEGMTSTRSFQAKREAQRLLGKEKQLLEDARSLVKRRLAFDTINTEKLLALGKDPLLEKELAKVIEGRLEEIEAERQALADVEEQMRLNIEITEKLASFLLASGVPTSSKLAGISLEELGIERKPADVGDLPLYSSNYEIRDSIFDQVRNRYQKQFQSGNVGKFEVWRSGGMLLNEP